MAGLLTLHPKAFGLDLSDLSLKIVSLEERGKGFRLSSFGEASIPEGVIEGGEIRKEEKLVQVIRKAVAEVKGKKIQTNYMVASLPEEKGFVQVVQFPPMGKEELGNAIRLQAENYIPYPVDTVYLDFTVIPPSHNHVDHLDVLIASLPRTIVDSYISAFEKAGFTPRALEIDALALSRAVIEKGVAPVPVLLVDVGNARTKFSIFSGYSLRFTTSVPVSANTFTQAVATRLGVEEERAEELKRMYGLDSIEEKLGDEVFQAMAPSATEFVKQIQKYLTYYETHIPHQHLDRPQKKIKKVVLCGGGANLRGLPEFLMRFLKVEVAVGNPWVNILSASLKELPALPFQDSLRYSTALGLGLRGVKREVSDD
ncbi:MAG TPA: type IV pilus assembly protein PilM [Candidatus Paceibacterota bacterium]|nr:type IV pilus assembly protein PilM [Candidatus Paceibacterota bacterium]